VDESGGVHSCTEDLLFHLCLTDEELIATGWKEFKDELIADGTITQADIDAEKEKPDVQMKLVALKQAL
jgi:hypothetical protein